MNSLDSRIALAFSDEARSDEIAALIDEAEAALSALCEASERRRERALDPTLLPADAEQARSEMEATAFHRDRMAEALRLLREQLEVARRRERNAQAREVYEHARATRDAVAAELSTRWPELEAEMVNLLHKLEESDAVIARANRELPEGTAPLSSVEKIARQLSGFMVDRVEVPRLATTRLPAFAFSPSRPTAWPQPQRIEPMFIPRWEPVRVFVKEPFDYQNGSNLPPRVYCGVQELPRALADLAIVAGLAISMDTAEGQELAKSTVVPPQSAQNAEIIATGADLARLDFNMFEWAQADVAEQRSEWRREVRAA